MNKHALLMAALAAALPVSVMAAEPAITFTKQWTYNHASTGVPGQVSEIPAFDAKTNTLWIAGVVGVDVLDATTGGLVEHIDVTAHGYVNSVAIHNGIAAFAIESATRTDPGVVLLYDTRLRLPIGEPIKVGALPDMLTFTHDGRQLLVANEGTPIVYGARIGVSVPFMFGPATVDPAGSVSIIDVQTRAVVATPGFTGVPVSGSHARLNTGMDFEPEYIAVTKDGRQAFVALQEANAMAVLDLKRQRFTEVIGLGVKDFSQPGNQIDPLNNNTVSFISPAVRGLYMPDGMAAYKWRGRHFVVMANEGDYREDDGDRSRAGIATFGATPPLDQLRISNTDSSPSNLYAAGARSFSIRDAAGNLVYDSGDILDQKAAELGIYDDGRSRDKGVEPEGVSLLEIAGHTYAFIGLERTLKGAVAVFDITEPAQSRYVDMIVTDGDRAPEGLTAYQYRGDYYLAIANEVSNTTTLYTLERSRPGWFQTPRGSSPSAKGWW